MPLTVAKTAGFCFGVRRAVDTVYEQLERIPSTSSPKLFTLGEIIHNAQVVEELDSLGAVAVDSLEKLLELASARLQGRPLVLRHQLGLLDLVHRGIRLAGSQSVLV